MQKSDMFWIFAFSLGFIFSFAVGMIPPGIGLFIFFNSAIAAVWYLAHKNPQRKDLEATKVSDVIVKILVGSYVVLTLPYLYRYDLSIVGILVAFHIFGLLLSVVLVVIPSSLHILNFVSLIIAPLSIGLTWLLETLKSTVELFKGSSNIVKLFIKIILYVAASLFVFILFANLLSSADAEFKTRIQAILDSLKLTEIMGRTVWGVVLSFIGAGYLTMVAYAQTINFTGSNPERSKTLWQKAFDVITMRKSDALLPILITIPVLLLFGLYVWVQSKYLLASNMDTILKQFSFAEYARRGFVELLVVGVLSYPLLAWTTNRSKSEWNVPRIVNFVLNSGIVALLVIMLYSLIVRMNVYMGIYGPSVLRNYVIVGSVFVGIGLLTYEVFSFIKMMKPGYSFMHALLFGDYAVIAVFTSIGLLGAVSLVPWNTIVVGQVQSYYEKTGSIDIFQLISLPDEAQPAVYTFVNSIGAQLNRNVMDEGVSLVKTHALQSKEAYLKVRNDSIFTQVFGLNYAGEMLRNIPGDATSSRNRLNTVIKARANEITADYIKALANNDFAAARKLYDPKMVANDIKGFASTTSIALADSGVKVNNYGDYDMEISASSRYVTATRTITITRTQTAYSVYSAQTPTTTVRPPLVKTTTQTVNFTLGFRDGEMVIVNSPIVLAYLPDTATALTDDSRDSSLYSYGYASYCEKPNKSNLFQRNYNDKCYQGDLMPGFLSSDFETVSK